MSDPRETPCNGRVAHVSLQGAVAADRFVEGTVRQVIRERSAILRAPGGPRDRELVFGEGFRVLMEENGVAYGLAERDGYCGHVAAEDLGPAQAATHRVAVRETYAKPTPELKVTESILSLSFGARVRVVAPGASWAGIALPGGARGHVPACHLCPVETRSPDPVAVAELFRGVPYLWGGNSARGIDCSGLVQAAMLACGIPCPGDSDQQAARLGAAIAPDAPRRRGDLWFWPGHVGLLLDADRLIHANAHHMAVAVDPLEEVIARIAAAEGHGVTLRRRVSPPRG